MLVWRVTAEAGRPFRFTSYVSSSGMLRDALCSCQRGPEASGGRARRWHRLLHHFPFALRGSTVSGRQTFMTRTFLPSTGTTVEYPSASLGPSLLSTRAAHFRHSDSVEGFNATSGEALRVSRVIG